MKILYVHNFHRSGAPSGDDILVQKEILLLQSKGHKVYILSKKNDDFDHWGLLKKMKLFFEIPWSRKAQKEIEIFLREEEPDIVHIHNIFPMFSPAIYVTLKNFGIPFVHTLHDFRLFCANALLFRNGEPCQLCIDKSPVFSILNRCFQNSFLKTIPVSLMMRNIRKKNLLFFPDFYIVLTKFAKEKFKEFGILEERLMVKPNFLFEDFHPKYEKENFAVYVGRISEEKGIEVLLEALNRPELKDIKLKIIGSGPRLNLVEKERPKNVEILGLRPHKETIDFIRNAAFLILPSIVYEGFPMVIVEAFACGTPVITTNFGAMSHIVTHGKTGLLFERKNPEDLAEKVLWLWQHPEERDRMAREARKEFEEKYTAERNYEILMKIYNKAIERHRNP